VAKAAYPAVVQTTANVAPATSALNQLTGQARDTTVAVQANTAAATNSINAVTAQQRSMVIAVGANTSAAEQAIARVVNGSYTATVTVTANVAQATAAIAGVPRTVSVTPPPPAAGLRAYAAPASLAAEQLPTGPVVAFHAAPRLRLDPTSLAAAGGNVTYQVEISGLIKDPDSAARAIERLLAGRGRRAGTVTAR
jgi:hypothetical protein